MRTPEIVHLLLLEGTADWEASYAVAGINQPDFQASPGRYAVATVGLTRDPVRTIGGLTILPDLPLEAVDPRESAMLILAGATAWDAAEQTAAAAKAAEFLSSGTPVAAICGATLGLAQAGLLNERTHTSNAREYLQSSPVYRGEGRYVDAPAVRDGDLITASGIAPLEFARCIFERLELFTQPVLEAWYSLYADRDPSAFQALMAQAPVAESA